MGEAVEHEDHGCSCESRCCSGSCGCEGGRGCGGEGGSCGCGCGGGGSGRYRKPTVLFLLSGEPRRGVEILERFGQLRLWKESPPDASGLYRLLREMERDGLVRSEIICAGEVGLARKAYALTEEGAAERLKWFETIRQYQEDLLELLKL